MCGVGINFSNQEDINPFYRVLVIGNGVCGTIASKALIEVGLSCVYAKVPKLSDIMYGIAANQGLASEVCPSEDTDGRLRLVLVDEMPLVNREGPFFKIECEGMPANLFGSIVFAFGFPGDNGLKETPLGTTWYEKADSFASFERIAFVLGPVPNFDPEVGISAVAAALAHQKGGGTSYIFFENMPVAVPGGELLYDQAKKAGVQFIRYAKDQEPTVKLIEATANGRTFCISAVESIVGETIDVYCDRVYGVGFAGTASIPDAIKGVANYDVDKDGFILSESIHCGLGQSFSRGIFAVGGCTGALGMAQMTAQAYSVAVKARARALLASRMASADTVLVNDKCVRCLTCLRICPHSAISVNYAASRSKIACLSTSCEECGLCISECPREALDLTGFPQMGIQGFLEDIQTASRRMFVVYGCERSTSDSVAKIDMPEGALFLAVPCAGRISESMLWDTLHAGASGVLVVGCHNGNCASRYGTDWARNRVKEVLRKLRESGVAVPIVSYATVSARQTKRLETLVHNFKGALEENEKGRLTQNEMGQ